MLRLKRTTQKILLHAMTMLNKLTCALKDTFCDEMKVGLTENKDDDSEDTPCDERKKTSFQHLKKGSKRVDIIPVTSVMNTTKY